MHGGTEAACSTRGSSDVARSVSAADVELPPGSVPDDRRDLVIRNDGSFRWGTWLGHVDGSDPGSALLIARPTDLRQRFDDFGASVSISIVGNRMQIWLPDLGQDRDVDFGDAVEDIDSPDMEFRRVRG
jgi:hypothetical protein